MVSFCLIRDTGVSAGRRKAEPWGTVRGNVQMVTPEHLGFPHIGVPRKVWALALSLPKSEVRPWGLAVRRSWVIFEGRVPGEWWGHKESIVGQQEFLHHLEVLPGSKLSLF